MTYSVRCGEQNDARVFSALINASGGTSLFRATFGHFHFSALVEYSCLSLIALTTNDEKEEICSGFLAINDSISATNTESDSFDRAIEELSNHLPVKVYTMCTKKLGK